MKSIFQRRKDFSFSWIGCLTKAKEPSLLYYLLVDEGITFCIRTFLRVLARKEMQTASSKSQNQITDSISNDNNRYA